MKITITKPASAGKVKIIPSKTAAHRLLIAGALSGLDISDKLNGISKDVDATKKCLINMKSGINKLPCGESGSTLRFLIPVAGAIGFDADFKAEGRLPKRPLSELKAAMEEHGCIMSEAGEDPIKVRGKLTPGTYRFPGNVSSQYITGMLFALPLLDTDSDILIDGTLQSRPYIDVTLDVLSKAGIDITETGKGFHIAGNQKYELPEKYLDEVEGDWSNGAFFIVMNAISKGEIEVKGLDIDSKQGDKRILDYVDIAYKSGEIEIDVSDIPDLVPAISVLAAARKKGEITKIVNAARLRLKESDRLRSVANALNSLGGSVTELNDSLVIEGSERLKGGAIDSYNDHRIVMMGAAASLISDGPVEIEGANAVSKSYPGFFDEYCRLGGEIR